MKPKNLSLGNLHESSTQSHGCKRNLKQQINIFMAIKTNQLTTSKIYLHERQNYSCTLNENHLQQNAVRGRNIIVRERNTAKGSTGLGEERRTADQRISG